MTLRSSIAHSRRYIFTSVLVLPCLVAAVIAGCGDDDSAPPVTTLDGGNDTGAKFPADSGGQDSSPVDTGAPDTGIADAGDDGAALAAKVARGSYIVNAVISCGDCHSPRGATGPIPGKEFSGVDCFISTDPSHDAGCLNSANLTNDETGLKNFTDDQIKNMFLNGKTPTRNLVNVMPYYVLHNMTDDDASSVVAYLRTLPGVSHTSRTNDPPFTPPANPSAPIDPALIPVGADAGLDAGGDPMNGRYLAQFVCMECHTQHSAPGVDPALQMTKVFGGGEDFPSAELGLPSPPFPADIYSANLTPDDTGLKTYSIEDIVKVLHKGLNPQDGGVCPPMPVGPNGAFGHLTDKDALDIASYIHNVPAVNNPIDGGNGACVAP
jgi:mono/diheme cytochrome c family protein